MCSKTAQLPWPILTTRGRQSPLKKLRKTESAGLLELEEVKLSQLTAMMKTIENLKIDGRDVKKVEEMLSQKFCKAFKEFEDDNAEVVALLDEDEGPADQHNWFEPRSAPTRDFVENTENWCFAMWKKVRKQNSATGNTLAN